MTNRPWQILLIEDNPDDRANLRQMLLLGSDRRYVFTETELGIEGLRKIREKHDSAYDCVLLDYDLPDMNAVEVLAELCARSNSPPCPVVVITGSARDGGAGLLRAGAQDYIGKNWSTPESLTRAVENAVERYALFVNHSHAEATLRETEAKLHLGVSIAGLGLGTIDYQANTITLDKTAAALFALPTNTSIPRSDVHARFHPDDGANLALQIAQVLNPTGNGFMSVEHRIVRTDGSMRWISARKQVQFSIPADHQAEPTKRATTGLLAVLDITDRKQAESTLSEALAAAKKANRAKSEFLSSMSHELRTPLNAILGFAQLIDSAKPPPTPAQKRSVDQIQKAGWYLLELINEVLDLALIESGKLPLSMEPLLLADVVRECQAMIEPQAQNSGISLAFAHFEHQFYIEADRTRLKQVLINLLSNAIKYNKAAGSVIVNCVVNSAGRMRIGVTDTGEGLAADKLPHLFQPFNRLGKETSSEEGTGIGLVMTKRLVELMGGEIGVASTVGVGSEFWFELNLTNAPDVAAGSDGAAAVAVVAPTNAQDQTLLYVEDNPANMMLVEDLVARLPNLHFIGAQGGIEGIELARAARPDVILMDINLPGVSGMTALSILAANPTTAHIPVIALSANALPSDIEKGLQAGFFRYLTKPIKVDEFMRTLNEALKSPSGPANRERRIGD